MKTKKTNKSTFFGRLPINIFIALCALGATAVIGSALLLVGGVAINAIMLAL